MNGTKSGTNETKWESIALKCAELDEEANIALKCAERDEIL